MAEGPNDPRAVMERFTPAINDHDLQAVVACFADDYRDVEPAHPRRRVEGGSMRCEGTGGCS